MEQKGAKPWWIWWTAMLLGLALAISLTAAWAQSRISVTCLGKSTSTRMVVPVGRTVGIKLFSRGVMVVGLADVTTQQGEESPARQCGLRTGDIITHIDGQQVDTIEQVQALLQSAGGETLAIQLTRGGRQVETQAAAVQCMSDGSYRLGAWIRDSMAGIGTITYYDPESGKFAALGHGINDVDTKLLMPLESGGVMGASVTDVQKGEKGTPGALHGSFDLSHDLGTLYANSDCGVFGVADADDERFSAQPVPVAQASEVKVGDAVLLTNVEGEQVESFSVEILRVYRCTGQDSRSMMIRVTDPDLLARTGGIVQGMSGSPILQDGKLVGALTHVLINDPTCGYAVFAETMLDAQ
jgi:stage IV sporulation protein B